MRRFACKNAFIRFTWKCNSALLFLFMLIASFAHAQTAYPKITGHISVVHPIVSFSSSGAAFNFDGSYTVGFPCGINILESDKAGFSLELVPFIKAMGGSSRVYNYLFHPGILFRYPKGFTIVARLAFETEGRYGFTAVFSKVIAHSGFHNYYVAMPVPFRFGNGKPASVGFALQVGITF